MAKKVSQRVRKLWKVVTIFFSIILCIAAVAVPAVLILDVTAVVPLLDGANRSYVLAFYNEDELLSQKQIFRGEEIDYGEIPEVTKQGNYFKHYTFEGWDYTGDGYADNRVFWPTKAYSNLTFRAVFNEVFDK